MVLALTLIEQYRNLLRVELYLAIHFISKRMRRCAMKPLDRNPSVRGSQNNPYKTTTSLLASSNPCYPIYRTVMLNVDVLCISVANRHQLFRRGTIFAAVVDLQLDAQIAGGRHRGR